MNNIKNIKAKVLRVDEEEHKFVIEVKDRIYKVAQVDFQRRQPAPETLNCLMITTHLGKVFIAQDIEHLMRKNYKENDEVNFKIKMALGNFYHLEDEFGFTAMLKRDTVINAALTPMVRCRILKFHQKYMDVQLVEVLGADKSEFSLSEKEFYDIIGEENWNTQEFRNLMLGDTPSDIFDLECHRWIVGLSDSLNQDELQILLHRAAILLYTSHRNPKKRQGGRYHQPNPLNPIHLRLYLSSAQAILHHAVHLHARFLHHGEIHRFHLNHHQRTGNVSMEQKTIPDAMDQTAPGIRGQYL